MPPEAKNRKSAILLILMVELKVCWWGASARGSGERSEPAAGRPRKEQAPKAPSRIASFYISKVQAENVFANV